MQRGRRVRLGLCADLNRLLQYLHGRVFGFCCRCSPFSSAVLGGGAVSIDWRGSMGEKAFQVAGLGGMLGYRDAQGGLGEGREEGRRRSGEGGRGG